MKRKILLAAVILAAITALTVLSCSAFEFRPLDGAANLTDNAPTQEAVMLMLDSYALQQEIGFIDEKNSFFALVYSGSGADGSIMQLYAIDDPSAVTISCGSTVGNFTSTKNMKRYVWTEAGWKFTSQYTQFSFYKHYFYVCSVAVPSVGGLVGFEGLNPNATFGTGSFNSGDVNQYLSYIIESCVEREEIESVAYADGQADGYESGYETGHSEGLLEGYVGGRGQGYEEGKNDGYTEGYNDGHSQGIADGKIECGTTHQMLIAQGYSNGYTAGQEDCDALNHRDIEEEAYNHGHSIGLIDCGKTHESLLREEYENGLADGMEIGAQENYDKGYIDGYGDNRQEVIDALAEGYDKGKIDGKEIGYTEALNDGSVIGDYVRTIFSAPLDGLYTMLNVEVLGINIFSLVMSLLGLVIAGIVVAQIFKFRR